MSYSQLVNNSEIDNKLIGNPQVTFFKSVFRRHTSFYKGLYSDVQKHFVYDAEPGTQKSPEGGISHGAFDLITNIFIEHKISNIASDKYIRPNIGNTIIKDIIFKVGNNDLFTVEGLYMEARSELDNPYIPSHNGSSIPPLMSNNGSDSGSLTLSCYTGSQYNINTMAGGVIGSNIKDGIGAPSQPYHTDTFYTYPNFYFCKEYGSSFPICALNNEITLLEINYRNFNEFTNSKELTTLSSTVHIEYVNLSDDERLRFINNTDPYMYYNISKVNLEGVDMCVPSTNLPIRQIFFVGQGINQDDSNGSQSLSTPTSLSTHGNCSGIDITINSDPLYTKTDDNLSIFTKHNIKHFKGYGRDLSIEDGKSSGYLDSIGVHSFCLDNTNTPSGHLSSSANTRINFKPLGSTDRKIEIYLEVINFYKISGGKLGIMFSS